MIVCLEFENNVVICNRVNGWDWMTSSVMVITINMLIQNVMLVTSAAVF